MFDTMAPGEAEYSIRASVSPRMMQKLGPVCAAKYHAKSLIFPSACNWVRASVVSRCSPSRRPPGPA